MVSDSVILWESPAADVEIEYVTEEPEIYEPNFIFFKRIFEAFKVQGAVHLEGALLSRGGVRGCLFQNQLQLGFQAICLLSSLMT